MLVDSIRRRLREITRSLDVVLDRAKTQRAALDVLREDAARAERETSPDWFDGDRHSLRRKSGRL